MSLFENPCFLTGEELSQSQLLSLLETAEFFRQRRGTRKHLPLKGKTIALMFEKPSLRTRVSFSVGVQELGGNVMELVGSQQKQEEPEDFIRVLQGMVQGLMLRTFAHSTLERMAAKAKIPLINGLSDSHHPCQALADLLTLRQQFGDLQGLRLAYIGDGNNVLHSLLLLAPFVGVDVHYACPSGYRPDADILKRAQKRAAIGKAKIVEFRSAAEAVVGTHAVYTDVWTSMGKESESAKRMSRFQEFQLNLPLFEQARTDAIAMHCLPMVREQEITSDVVEHPRSALFQQAENRLHAQKALMVGLFQQKAAVQDVEYSHVV